MASLRPASRLYSRKITQLSTPIRVANRITRPCSSSLFRPATISQPSPSQLHTSTYLSKDAPRVPPKDFESNDAYPAGSPGEPKKGESLPSGIPPSTLYTLKDIESIISSPESFPDKLLVDVREPGELLEHGRIPGAVNVPISSAPDAFFLSAEDFEDKYGFARPGGDMEVVFYCKAGVRSKAAARLAAQSAFGGRYGEFPGSFVEWQKAGGKVQRD